MNEETKESLKAKTVARIGSLQRDEEEERAQVKDDLRKKIRAVREGHGTGGYCESEKLQAEEKKLYAILATELEELKRQFGYSPDPKFKHPRIRQVEVELYGLSWKPKLVVAE